GQDLLLEPVSLHDIGPLCRSGCRRALGARLIEVAQCLWIDDEAPIEIAPKERDYIFGGGYCHSVSAFACERRGVWAEHHIAARKNRIGFVGRLGLEDIQRRSCDATLVESLHQSLLVDQPTPRHIDEKGLATHHGKRSSIDQMYRFGS